MASLSNHERSGFFEILKRNKTRELINLTQAILNDIKKGGDIDLYVELQTQNVSDVIDAKLRFLCELHKKLGEQKIGVVLRRPDSPNDLPIYQIAKSTGILLQ